MNVLLSAIGFVLFSVTVVLALTVVKGLLGFLTTLLLVSCIGAALWKLVKAGFYKTTPKDQEPVTVS